MMNHKQVQELLAGFALGELSPEQNLQIQQHLNQCDNCRQEARRMQKVLQTADCLKAQQTDPALCLEARQRLSEAVQRMDSHPAASAWWSRPLVQYAAAAVLLAGALLALHTIGPDQRFPDSGKLTTVTQQVLPTALTPEQTEILQKELAQAAHYFEQNNVQGLAGLLQTGQEETRQKAAEYLSQIGDSSVLNSLEILSSQWTGDPKDNPYQKAVEAIRQRQAPLPR
jgi:uncharacterized membrane protein YccC